MRKFVVICFVLFAACTDTTNVDVESEKKMIIELTDNWSKFSSPEEYLNYITDDFIHLGNGAKPITNRDSMYKFISDFCKYGDLDFPDWTSDEIILCNDIAIHRYSGDVYFYSKEDSSILLHDNYKYMDVLRKTHNGWRIARHMSNRNK